MSSFNSDADCKLMGFVLFLQMDWDLRLACLLLYAFDIEDNFWQLCGDFLPGPDECTSLLLAPKVSKS
jgi:histone-lysine N-methyltransferase SETD3